MDEILYSRVRKYINIFRPTSDVDNVFLTWNGVPLEASNVANAISTELTHVGFRYNSHCTKIRQAASTLVCALLSEDDQASLASLMTHSRGVQQSHYNLIQTTSSHVRISNITRKLLTEEEITAEDLKDVEQGF